METHKNSEDKDICEAFFSAKISPISKNDSSVAARFIIPSSAKEKILAQLKMFGVCRETLFADSPDIVFEEIKKDTLNALKADPESDVDTNGNIEARYRP